MFNYVIRRLIYAVPILLGVNIIVFFLFFGINSPDDMARLHLGGKRVTHELIENWKKERSLDYPLFYNNGFSSFKIITALQNENSHKIILENKGNYRFHLISEKVQTPTQKDSPAEKVKKRPRNQIIIKNYEQIKGNLTADKIPGNIATENEKKIIEFEVKTAPITLDLEHISSEPGIQTRILFEFKKDLTWWQHYTDTIFFQKSLKMLVFDFGKSDRGKDIRAEITSRILPSMSVTIPIFFLSLVLNVFFAMLLAYFRGTTLDKWGVIICVIAMSVSTIIFIIVGQVIFGKWLKWFPISGYGEGLFSLQFIILPVLVAIISSFGSEIRFYRTIFLEEMNKDYIRTARAKGLNESRILFVHLLKNAMIPILTGVVVSLPLLFIGSLLLESFFGIPGMGSYLIDAIQQQDFAVVQSMVSLGSFLYIIGLVLTDISYTLVDPRVVLK